MEHKRYHFFTNKYAINSLFSSAQVLSKCWDFNLIIMINLLQALMLNPKIIDYTWFILKSGLTFNLSVQSKIRGKKKGSWYSYRLFMEQTMNYWLMKSEPDVFGINDLYSRPDQTEHWDGVRNYQLLRFLLFTGKIPFRNTHEIT